MTLPEQTKITDLLPCYNFLIINRLKIRGKQFIPVYKNFGKCNGFFEKNKKIYEPNIIVLKRKDAKPIKSALF